MRYGWPPIRCEDLPMYRAYNARQIIKEPGKRVAWKAEFLKFQPESPEATLSRVTAEMAKPRIAKSARNKSVQD